MVGEKKTDFGFAWVGEEIDLRWWWDAGDEKSEFIKFNSNSSLISVKYYRGDETDGLQKSWQRGIGFWLRFNSNSNLILVEFKFNIISILIQFYQIG